jgi:hypothetical protein
LIHEFHSCIYLNIIYHRYELGSIPQF